MDRGKKSLTKGLRFHNLMTAQAENRILPEVWAKDGNQED
jgi:hypothetical protein